MAERTRLLFANGRAVGPVPDGQLRWERRTMGLRIRLVEPRPAGHNVYDRLLLPRLGLPLMARMLTEAGHDVRIYCETLAPVDLHDLLGADLVGVSSITATTPAAYRLADLLGTAGVPVVLGGPHVSFRADEALGHAHYVVRGEGQQTMCELVTCLVEGRPLEGVRGLSFRADDGEPHHNPARPRCTQEEFERLPIPDLSLIEGSCRMTMKPLMTQWGCPFDCEFCSVVAMFSRSVRHRRVDQVLPSSRDSAPSGSSSTTTTSSSTRRVRQSCSARCARRPHADLVRASPCRCRQVLALPPGGRP